MFKLQTEKSNKEIIEFITRMAYIAEMKEWDNRLHTERIRRYCQVIASGLHMAQNEIEVLSLASQLHDVGKIHLPEDLLKRTGNYDGPEWEAIEKHTTFGAKILSGSSSSIIHNAETIAATHHERWNGSGYPAGIRGANIPLSGRIVALADVFDALTTKRLYKETVTEAEALNLIQESSNILFDPHLVDVFYNRFGDILKSKHAVDG